MKPSVRYEFFPSPVIHGPVGVVDSTIIMKTPCGGGNIVGRAQLASVGVRGGCGGGRRGTSRGGDLMVQKQSCQGEGARGGKGNRGSNRSKVNEG